jgi:hypothetical protein
MMRQAYLRQARQRPAVVHQASASAIPIDPRVQALLDVEPFGPNSYTWTPSTEKPDYLNEDNQYEAQLEFLMEYNNLALDVGKHG